MALAATGLVLGYLGAVALTRSLAAILFEVSATDPLAFAVAGGVVVAISLTTALAPMRRSGRIDPALTLRIEG
jgi:predicted lysophospholipase L1 biosynthesis ABC-type transport system permease subunit